MLMKFINLSWAIYSDHSKWGSNALRVINNIQAKKNVEPFSFTPNENSTEKGDRRFQEIFLQEGYKWG